MHEFVLSARNLKREHGITALDVAKRLMDYGFHPPTVYFPLIVAEALMIEPTETETKEMLDAFADAMLEIAREADDDPDVLKEAPHRRPVKRLGRGQGGEARGRQVRLRRAPRPGGRSRARRAVGAPAGDARRRVSDPTSLDSHGAGGDGSRRWRQKAQRRATSSSAIVEFADDVDGRGPAAFQDVLLRKRAPGRSPPPAQRLRPTRT